MKKRIDLSVIVPVRIERPAGGVINNLSNLIKMCDKENVELIIVENNSIGGIPKAKIHLTLDLPGNWNQPIARNYGLRIASGQNVLLLDAEHIITPHMIHFAESVHIPSFEAYMLPRSQDVYTGKHTDVAGSHHPGSLLFRRHSDIMFDERFAGNYGYDDKHFNRQFDRIYAMPNWHGHVALCVEGNHHNMDRNTHINQALFETLSLHDEMPENRFF